MLVAEVFEARCSKCSCFFFRDLGNRSVTDLTFLRTVSMCDIFHGL